MRKKSLALLAPALLLGGALSAQVTMKNLPAEKNRGRLIELKNPFLSVMINVDKAGLVDSFIPAGSGHEEVYVNSAQRCSFGEFRPPEMSYNELHELYATPAVCRIVKNTPEEVRVTCTSRIPAGRCGGLELTLTHVMKADSAVLYSSWTLTNRSNENRTLLPWIRNIVSGYRPPQIQFGSKGLDTDSSIMLPCGTYRKLASESDFFVEPARNWFARVPKVPSPEKNILYCIFDYDEVFQFYTVHFKYLHTMELLFRMIELKPGESWTARYLLASAGTMPDVRFASPDIAADLTRKDGKLELLISSPRNLKDAEVRLLNAAGKTVGKIKTDISACKTSVLTFPDAKGEIFELKVLHQGKDLMQDPVYAPKGAKMTATLHQVQGVRRPENLPVTLQPWPKSNPAFAEIKPRAVDAALVKTSRSDLQVWPADSLVRVLESDHPAKKTFAEDPSYRIAAAGGEREHFQLAVRNTGKTELKDFSLELSSNRIPAENLQWNVLDYITTTQPSMGQKLIGRWPDVLDPARSFAVKPGQTRTVWIEVRIPRGLKAGTYQASVKLLRQKETVAELPLKIRVFGFELPVKPNMRTDAGMFFGNPPAMAARYGYKGKKQDLSVQLAEALLAHRMSPRGLPVPASGNLKEYEKWLKRYIDAGANVFFFPKPQYVGKKRVEELEKLFEKYGILKDSYVYAFDEIHADQIPKVREWCEKWHKERKVPILVVYYGGPVEPLYGSIDIWCRAHWKEDKPLLADRLGKDQVWTTNSPFFPVECDPVVGRAKIWQAFSEGMNGCLLWSVAAWTTSPYATPFRSGTNLTGVMFYPAPEGVRPGARFKMMSDAVDDFDYLYFLREEVRKAKQEKRDAKLVREAEKLLADQFYLKKGLTAAIYQANRFKAGELIEQFRKTAE